MDTIGGIGSLGNFGGATANVAIETAIQAQVQASAIATVSTLFGSLGLGANTDTTA